MNIDYERLILDNVKRDGFFYIDPFNDSEMSALKKLESQKLVMTKFSGISLTVIPYKEET